MTILIQVFDYEIRCNKKEKLIKTNNNYNYD